LSHSQEPTTLADMGQNFYNKEMIMNSYLICKATIELLAHDLCVRLEQLDPKGNHHDYRN